VNKAGSGRPSLQQLFVSVLRGRRWIFLAVFNSNIVLMAILVAVVNDTISYSLMGLFSST